MQDGATLHRTYDVFDALQEVYDTRVIGLGYQKFSNGAIEWLLYSPDLNPIDQLTN